MDESWRKDLANYMKVRKQEIRLETVAKREELNKQRVLKKKPKWEIS